MLRHLIPEIKRSSRRMPSLVEDVFRDPFFQQPFALMNQAFKMQPAVDIKETDKEYMVEAEVPGMQKENLDIQVLNNHRLVLSGTLSKEHKKEDDKHHFLNVERQFSSFRREFELPTSVDPGKIAAKLKDGVLTVSVPKEELQTSKVDIAE